MTNLHHECLFLLSLEMRHCKYVYFSVSRRLPSIRFLFRKKKLLKTVEHLERIEDSVNSCKNGYIVIENCFDDE